MSGYVATARITRVSPHWVGPETHATGEPSNATIEDAPAIEDVSGEPFLAALEYLWDDIREVWGQAMDVLRDPQGWR